MKILIIPDQHGSHNWEIAKSKIDEVDYVVFLGDSVDSFDNKHPDQEENLKNIFDFVRKNKRVTNDINPNITKKRIKKNPFGIGRALPGMAAILILVAGLFFGQEFLNRNTPSNQKENNQTITTQTKTYGFRNFKYLNEHYEKHGKEMGYSSPEEYLAAANSVINNPASLHKLEKEDKDDVYYLQATNDFVILSTDGYIRTYFRPNGGMKYYMKQ